MEPADLADPRGIDVPDPAASDSGTSFRQPARRSSFVIDETAGVFPTEKK
jgi:hypothetical protein